MRLFVTAPAGTEALVVDELRALGLSEVKQSVAGVHARGEVVDAYRACLWSRVASRVLVSVAELPAGDPEQLYRGARELAWTEHLSAEDTLAVDVSGSSETIGHTGFAALKVKDAVVDHLRAATGARPNVDPENPGLRLNLHLRKNRALLSIDLAGQALHRRGYRRVGVEAPMKENLAAAVLLRARWPEISAAAPGEVGLFDPMCGSGTLLIEGAWMAADIAPGLLRAELGSPAWRAHAPEAWEALLEEARARREAGLARLGPVAGSDADPRAVEVAGECITVAGLEDRIVVSHAALAACRPNAPTGLLVSNPPYGARLGEPAELRPVYAALGQLLEDHFVGWEAALLLGEPGLGRHLGLRARRRHTLHNGPIECKLLRFEVAPQYFEGAGSPRPASPESQAFANRLRKNRKKLKAWIAREKVEAYRLYDADLPEYAVVVDVYGDHVHLQEYAPPDTVDREKARARLRDAVARTVEVLEIPRENVHVKTRKRQRGKAQYERVSEVGVELKIREGPARFWVNLTDYLDTGLFLDHRPTRRMVAELAHGGRLANLFCYTASISVQAALAGARASTSVDLSRTYLDWAERNFELNRIDTQRHRLVQADCLRWMTKQRPGEYDVVFLDPPTFSTSKRMEGTLDVQRDHVALIHDAMRLVAPGGVLVFSTNRQKFKLADDELSDLDVRDVTRDTVPPDYARTPKVHRCWQLRRR